MKKRLLFFTVFIVIISLTACSGKKAPGTNGKDREKKIEKRVIKVSTKFVDDEQTAVFLKKVVKAINERACETLDLQLFTGGILPIGKDGMEQIVKGSNWILVDGINFLGDYVPDYNAVTGPFIYRNFDEFLAMTQTDLVKKLNKDAEALGIKVLILGWVFGFRSMMTNKEIRTPKDMNGLNIRVPNSQLYTYTLEAMGANPVSMPYPDTYAAIQQGVIDGIEGSIMTYWGTKQYENVKNYSLTNHLLGCSAVMISTKLWNELTQKERTIIQEEFDRGQERNLQATLNLEAEYADKLKIKGVKFNEVDSDAFMDVAGVVFTKLEEWTPGIYEQIKDELKKIRSK